MSRNATNEKIILGETIAEPKVISRIDRLYHAIIHNETVVPFVPKSDVEKYLANIIDDSIEIPTPHDRVSEILYAICTSGSIENFIPMTENEELLNEILENGIGSGYTYSLDGDVLTITKAPYTMEGSILTIV